MLSKEQTKNVFFAVAIILILFLIFRNVKVTCECRAAIPAAGSISLQPCTWEGEEACIKKDANGMFLQYPEIPFNNPYPYYNPANGENPLNPWPNPPREGVVPQQFNSEYWKPDRWKPDSIAWKYKDTMGHFPSVIDASRQRYYQPPFSRRQPPYYMMEYPQYKDKTQSFYKWLPNSADKEPVTNAVWPFTVEPMNKKAGSKHITRSRCEDEPNYHDFAMEQRSHY